MPSRLVITDILRREIYEDWVPRRNTAYLLTMVQKHVKLAFESHNINVQKPM